MNYYIRLLIVFLATVCPFLNNKAHAQAGDTTRVINMPLPHEDFSIYDFAEIRAETDKTTAPPEDIVKRKFQPVKEIFPKNELHFADSVKSVWIKFQIANNLARDTSVALIFHPGGVSKAVLYKSEGGKILPIAKTGFFIAVVARTISYVDNRMDLSLKAHSETTYFVQVNTLGQGKLWMWGMLRNMPLLESFAYAEMKAFKREKEVNRLNFLWTHFFIGVFFMFFVFGFIKYLMLGRDKAYLYYSLMGLFNVLLAVSMSEYPPLELTLFENARGIELWDVVAVTGLVMQGLFILEILQIKTKYPRFTRAIKWYFVLWLAIEIVRAYIFFAFRIRIFLEYLVTLNAFIFLLLLLECVEYLATIRKGFYRFIFLGALTIFISFTLDFVVQFFGLQYLLPAWFNTDPRASAHHFFQAALVIDMLFYFSGLAYRDRQVEKDKVLFQEQLKIEKLQSEVTKAELQHRASELEMQALRAQMNPHFIFNSLNSINRFILQKQGNEATEYLTKFSRLIRMILNSSANTSVSLAEDLEALQLYLELESLRFEKKFGYKIECDPEIDPDFIQVPPMLLQPFVENAIWHGLMNKEGEGHLWINIDQPDSTLICTITDDGIGRKKAAELEERSGKHKSMGMKITESRIAMMKKMDGENKSVEVRDLVDAKGSAAGTEVVLRIPVMQQAQILDK